MGATFFFRQAPSPTPESAHDTTSAEQKLALREDSIYQSRRHPTDRQTHTHQEPARINSHTQHNSQYYNYKDTIHAARPPFRREALLVELNSADTLTLQLLPGIGPARARAIVRYRERLGGFVDAGQLLEVWGIDTALLDRLAPMLRVDTALVRPLPVNQATLKQLLRHPYMGYYQARDLVQLRSSGVRFASADDLRAIPSMTDSALARLLPYVGFSDTISSTAQ